MAARKTRNVEALREKMILAYFFLKTVFTPLSVMGSQLKCEDCSSPSQ